MPPTVFIAVQCCQCSTMQVKQQRKSSNKWTCVVCNQKQFIRKVFAQGFMAKDLREFVQSFNMSRKFQDENLIQNEAVFVPENGDGPSSYQKARKRSDWSEYMDPEEDFGDNPKIELEDDYKVQIVTEMPNEMFKKPKLKNYSRGSRDGDSSRLLKSTFSNRKLNKPVINHGFNFAEGQLKKLPPATAMGSQEWSSNHQPEAAKGTSKWGRYMTQDDDLKTYNETEPAIYTGQWNGEMLDNVCKDEMVEEDIHPDFM